MGKNKYFNKRCFYDGIKFASIGERSCYLLLKAMPKEVQILELQPKVYLTESKILYKPDFKILDLLTREVIWVEFKGKETTDWKLKKRLWINYGPGPLRIYKGSGLRISCVEQVVPFFRESI